jgi:hypothetical protein
MDVDRQDEAREPERYRFLTLYLPYLVLTAVAFLWPADDALLGVDFRTSWLARSVPSIAGYSEKSAFPSATSAYLVLSGVLFAPLFVLGLARPETTFTSREQMRSCIRKMRKWRPFPMLFFVGMGVAGVFVSWMQPGYEDAPVSSQRWALALQGPLLSFFTLSYAAVCAAVMSVRFSFFVPVEELRDGLE